MAAVCMARHSHCFFLSLSGGTYGTPKGKKMENLYTGILSFTMFPRNSMDFIDSSSIFMMFKYYFLVLPHYSGRMTSQRNKFFMMHSYLRRDKSTPFL